jgi:hypothetical protein
MPLDYLSNGVNTFISHFMQVLIVVKYFRPIVLYLNHLHILSYQIDCSPLGVDSLFNSTN